MSKNKRYKRLTKRIQGTCIKNEWVCGNDCKYYKECEFIIWNLDLNTPMFENIKKIRDGLKGVTKYD